MLGGQQGMVCLWPFMKMSPARGGLRPASEDPCQRRRQQRLIYRSGSHDRRRIFLFNERRCPNGGVETLSQLRGWGVK